MNTKQEILSKWNEYKTQIQFTNKELDALIDKGIMSIMEFKKDNTILKLCFNDFGAYLRSYQDDILECQLIRLI